jgi:magnesium-protoporphyrin IX monomethyl ester (oxidative) cyclase
LLVNMPWAEYHRPSIQLGLLKALLVRAKLDARVLDTTLWFAEAIGTDAYRAADDYYRPTCEWLFTHEAFPAKTFPTASDPAPYLAFLRREGYPPAHLAELRGLRDAVGPFLDRCLAHVLELAPRIVGFTTSMLQLIPAVALARRIKQARPDIQIVFGGAACEGQMGAAIPRAFACVDVVVRGECDAWIDLLMARLLAAKSPAGLPWVVWRDSDGELHQEPKGDPFEDLEHNPRPDFDDYFETLAASPLHGSFECSLPFEGSRGCWWGERAHCRFCGLNGLTMTYRSRSSDTVVNELAEQRQRYAVDTFIAVDEIIPTRFFDELPPRLRALAPGLRLFYEMSPAVKRSSLEQLAVAVQLHTQPGIESLCTPVLEAMNKKLRGINNVALLRRAQELGVHLLWNVIFGCPGERVEHYDDLLRHLPALFHLQPPNVIPLSLARYSPYHDDPASFGLRVCGPRTGLRYAYPIEPALLDELAMTFEYEYIDGYDPTVVGRALASAVEQWHALYPSASLHVELRRDRARVEDRRLPQASTHELSSVDTVVYRQLEAARTAEHVAQRIARASPSVYLELRGLLGVKASFNRLYRKGLVWREGPRCVALGIPTHPGFWLDHDAPPRRLPLIDQAPEGHHAPA